MKKLVIILMLMLATTATITVNAQKHRHTSNPGVTATVDKNDAAVTANDNADSTAQGIVAYSDTTSATPDSIAIIEPASFDNPNDDPDFQFVNKLFNSGGFVTISIIAIIFGFLLLALPVILVALLLYFLYKRNKEHNKIIEEAINKGVAIPQEALPTEHTTDTVNMKKGIKNVAIGIGLAVMFHIMNIDFLCAIGWFIAIYGAGQLAIMYFSKGNQTIQEIKQDPTKAENQNEEKIDNYDKSE